MNTKKLIERLTRLDEMYGPDIEIAQFLTGSIGVNSESGEFLDIVKKILFQGKEFDNDTMNKLRKELGDVFFYLMHCCSSLGLDPMEIVEENMTKLQERFPDGRFTITHSENRKPGDV